MEIVERALCEEEHAKSQVQTMCTHTSTNDKPEDKPPFMYQKDTAGTLVNVFAILYQLHTILF